MNCLEKFKFDIDQISISLPDSHNSIISVFPNPTRENLYITVDNSNMNYSVEIMDVSGRLIRKIRHVSQLIDVSDLDKGIYYINIKNKLNDSIHFEKLVVL